LNVTVTTANRISGYCYDSAGNLLDQTTCPANPPHTYTYNAQNQLTSAGGVTYSYDGDDKRVQKSNGKLYWYGMGSDPLDETDLAGNTNNSSFLEYVFFGGKRIARRDYLNNVNYYFADHLGTARVITNAGGTILDDSDFYPFGGERPILSSSGNTYKFTGKERDSESGLDNFGARYDSSSMGRFMSPDSPSYSNHKNPQSWNLYAFALNNPVTFRDVDGHKVECTNNVEQCKKDAAAATGANVQVQTVQDKPNWFQRLFHLQGTTHNYLTIPGDTSGSAPGSNAAKLAGLIADPRTVSVKYDSYAKPSFWAGGVKLNGGSTSYVPSQGYDAQAFIDPTRTPGAVYDQDAVDQHIPQADTAEEFGHEVLGHIYGEMLGGAPAGTRANMRDSIIGENAVRALDPTRGQKGLESHHNYNEMPPDPPKPQQ
jgi:RHS repeat-associated protein